MSSVYAKLFNMNTLDVEPWVGVPRIAKHLGMTVEWVRARAAVMPHVRVGREYRFRLSEVDQWFQRFRQGDSVEEILRGMW